MKLSHSLFVLPIFALSLSACSNVPLQPTTSAPASLQVPQGQNFAFELTATGVQIYSCKVSPKDAQKYEWTFVAPEAELFSNMNHAGMHGAGPYWSMDDGGRIVGEVIAKADSPDANAIPWLMLKVKSNAGVGKFASIKSIQRVATTQGKAPASGCDAMNAGKELRVPYTATYNFFQ